MGMPAFLTEMEREANRPKLWFSIRSGFALCAAFALIAILARAFGLTPYGIEYALLVGFKLATNVAAWWSLRKDRLVLETATLNVVGDVIVMTGALYFTGGPMSPLLPIYVIEICVVALLSNLAVTLMVAGLILVCFAAMTLLMAAGVLVQTPTPTDPHGGVTGPFAAVVLVYAGVVIGVPTFITSRILGLLRQKEHALETRTGELIEAGKQRSQFLASVTHELRTPIHGIQGLVDLIATGVYGPVSDRQRDACVTVRRSAQGLLGLIDDLLDLTRAEVGRLEPKPGPVDLTELVSSVAASVSWMVGTKRLTLTSDLGRDLPLVESDRRLLGHVLVNLVANAAKFTPEGGRVTVRVRVDRRGAVLEVEDTGIGIAEDQRDAIFEAFRQVDGSDEKGYGGVGLGLALVRRLVGLLHGTIELDSVVGTGSTFRVIVPVHWPPPPPPPPPDPRGRRTGSVRALSQGDR
jgi:signal transduction histidine kinase